MTGSRGLGNYIVTGILYVIDRTNVGSIPSAPLNG